MKAGFGVLVLAAREIIYVSALAVPSLYDRQVSNTDTSSLDIRTIIGSLNVSATPDATSTFCSSGISMPTALVTDSTTDTASDIVSTTSTPTGTVTVTVTDVEIVTAGADPISTTNTAPVITISTNAGQFGGQAGQAIAESAPTGGAIVTIGGGAFGGVVGALQVQPSTSTIIITATATATAVVTAITSTESTTALSVTETPAQAVGAFGGIVGSQIFVSNLVSTVSSFSGFGGVAGLVSASPSTASSFAGFVSVSDETTASPTSTGGYFYKRAAFTTAVNVTTSQTGITNLRCLSLICSRH